MYDTEVDSMFQLERKPDAAPPTLSPVEAAELRALVCPQCRRSWGSGLAFGMLSCPECHESQGGWRRVFRNADVEPALVRRVDMAHQLNAIRNRIKES